MNHESAEGLISFAHPVILRPAKNVARYKEIRVPPFPDIDLNWDGFTLPCLDLAGFNLTDLEQLPQKIQLVIAHECCHRRLSCTYYSVLVKDYIYELYDLIATALQEEERIDVPVIAKADGNSLQKQMFIIERLIENSLWIEEVFAVRSSLRTAIEEGLITAETAQGIAAYSKEAYGYIAGFEEVYDAFDFVSGEIGENAAFGLVFSALKTLIPDKAFIRLIFNACKSDPQVSEGFMSNLSKEVISVLKNSSVLDASRVFDEVLTRLDPDGSLFRQNIIAKLFEGVTDLIPNLDNPILANYSYREGSYYNIDFHKRIDKEMELIICLEAIRQQIRRGIGLCCPFYSRDTCCGNRLLFEQVWKCTNPDRSQCKLWERIGCLENESVTELKADR